MLDQTKFTHTFNHGLDVRDGAELASALDRAGFSVEAVDALDGQVDGIIASDAIEVFYDSVAGLNGRPEIQRAGDEYAI